MASETWCSPFGSHLELTRIIGIGFKPAGSSLESDGPLDDRQNDIVRYLERNRAIEIERPAAMTHARAAMPPRGRVWVDRVDPYALQVCKDDLQGELPRALSAAHPVIEAMTKQSWNLNPASITTRLPSAGHVLEVRAVLNNILTSLQRNRLIELEDRGDDTVAIVNASRKLSDHVMRGFVATKFQKPSVAGKTYDLKQLDR